MPFLFFQLPHVLYKSLLVRLLGVSGMLMDIWNAFASLLTNPAKRPSFVTQTYLRPSLTKHSYTRSIGERMSSAMGA
jgi:hypothetical protein